MATNKICTRCIMDTTDPEITFDADGICNKCTAVMEKLHAPPYSLSAKEKQRRLMNVVAEIKEDGKGKEYDCIIGVSGGVDSTYVAYKVKELGLRPLAVHLDNGWNSELAQKNIENFLKKLDIDLYTYVINWEEFKDLQLSFLKASTPDSEIPSDHAIVTIMYDVAARYDLHYIVTGVNIATESIRATGWSNGIYDWKYIKSIHAMYGTKKLKTFPHFSLAKLAYFQYIKKIRRISLLDYIDYHKATVLKSLKDELDFRYYGDKHYESIYTRFYQAHILPTKFGFDKRKVHLSSLICSGQMTRKEALAEMKKPLYDKKQLAEDRQYVIKKLGLTEEEYTKIMQTAKKRFLDYPSYQNDWYFSWIWNVHERYKQLFKHKYFY